MYTEMFLKVTSIIDHTFMSPLVRYHHFENIIILSHDEEQKPDNNIDVTCVTQVK